MKITLAEYNPDWKGVFEKERCMLLDVLGYSVGQIEHIGSTSVFGLISKPIIDIMLGLTDFAKANSLVEVTVGLGYTYFPQYEGVMPNRKFFKKLNSETSNASYSYGRNWRRVLGQAFAFQELLTAQSINGTRIRVAEKTAGKT